MKHRLQILEEFQSSSWGQIMIREAISIASDCISDDMFVYIFKKVKDIGRDEGRKVFIEGWTVTDEEPTYYSSIGSTDEPRSVGQFMETLYSKQGERKRPTQPDTRFWSLWYTFNLMFEGTGLVIKDGRVTVTDKEYMDKLILDWTEVLSKADGRPMILVLGEYSMEEMDSINNFTANELEYHLDKVKDLLDGNAGDIFDNTNSDILTKGMDGKVKSAKNRLLMRYNFWKGLLNLKLFWKDGEHEDALSLAKTYSITTDKWKPTL